MNLSQLFNDCSDEYLKYRPSYPVELFTWLSECVTEKNLIWDVGTGNGQAAIMLADYFDKVIATDVNCNQIKCAQFHPRVSYYCESAENVHLSNQSVDLITAASAVHWFDLQIFYKECMRVLKQDGVIAVWSYTWPESSHISIEKKLSYIKNEILGNHWSYNSRLHLNHYRDLYFPFTPLSHPSFTFKKHWSIDELLYFISTWATVQAYIKTVSIGFMQILHKHFQHAWPTSEEKIEFDFPIALRVGKYTNLNQAGRLE